MPFFTNGQGANFIVGSNSDDEVLFATGGNGAGNDTIEGRGGDDLLPGGDDDDLIYGGAGDDFLEGAFGVDTLYGGSGNDFLFDISGSSESYGGTGDDRIEVSPGTALSNDSFLADGGDGKDTLSMVLSDIDVEIDLTLGTANTSTFFGFEFFVLGGGNDTVTGTGGRDNVNAGAGNNLLQGFGGDDVLTGGQGTNTFDGGAGDDSLTVLDGSDLLFGGKGNDTISAGFGNDTVNGGSGNDLILADPVTGSGEGDLIEAGAGDDEIMIARGPDTIEGGLGIDTLRIEAPGGGSSLVDLKTGQLSSGGGTGSISGVENLIGIDQAGFRDTLRGNGSDNGLSGRAGNDILEGRAGNDLLDGGAGADSLTGGIGADLFVFSDTDVVADFSAGQGDLLAMGPLLSFGAITQTVTASGVLISAAGASMLLEGLTAQLTQSAFDFS